MKQMIEVPKHDLAEQQTRRIERALNMAVWEVENVVDDLRTELSGLKPYPLEPQIPKLLHEAEGILLDGNDPGLWLMKELKRIWYKNG